MSRFLTLFRTGFSIKLPPWLKLALLVSMALVTLYFASQLWKEVDYRLYTQHEKKDQIATLLQTLPIQEIEDPRLAREMAQSIIELNDQGGFQYEEGQAQYYLSKICLAENKREEDGNLALTYGRISFDIFQQWQDPYWEAMSSIQLARVFQFHPEPDSIQKYLELGKRAVNQLDENEQQAAEVWGELKLNEAELIKIQLGENKDSLTEGMLTQKRIKTFEEAIQYFEQARKVEGKAIALRNLGIIYTNIGEFDKADTVLHQSNHLMSELKSDIALVRSLTKSGKALIRRYLKTQQLNDFEKGLRYYQQALSLPVSEKTELFAALGVAYFHLYYHEDPPAEYDPQTSINRSVSYLQQGIEAARKEVNSEVLNDILLNLERLCGYTTLEELDCQSILEDSWRAYQEILTISKQDTADALEALAAYRLKNQQRKQRQQRNLYLVGGLLGLTLLICSIIISRQKIRSRFAQRDLQNRLRALSAQMNPHFISNSLNAIEGLISANRSEEASRYLGQFAQLSRIVMGSSQMDTICLADETELLKKYLELEQVRMEPNMSYKLYIEETIDPFAIRIPPMMIQPFVENAIWHGIKPKGKPGHISVQFFWDSASRLRCTIEDDGIGRTKSKELQAESEHPRLSHSTQIIQERIHVLKKQLGADLRIKDLLDENGIGVGTKVEMTFVVTQNAEDEFED